MKYTVIIGINRFEIPDGTTALSFAELAIKYFVPTEYNTELKPLISIEDETKNADVIVCADCKYNDEGGYCAKNERTVDGMGTCECAERW